jgi:hypothetical protein
MPFFGMVGKPGLQEVYLENEGRTGRTCERKDVSLRRFEEERCRQEEDEDVLD